MGGVPVFEKDLIAQGNALPHPALSATASDQLVDTAECAPPLIIGRERTNAELPKLPERGKFTESARQNRLRFLEEQTGVKLEHIPLTALPADRLRRTTESFIGTIEVPIGVAGPLVFRGENVTGLRYAPMATTEGSLVASATRGATAISHAGGVVTATLGRRISRVPLFQMHSLSDALFFADWLKAAFDDIRAQAMTMSSHADLKYVAPEVFGRDVHVHFVYDSQDAAGQNMTTGCTWRACQWILGELERRFGKTVEQFLIEANLSSDKKATFHSLTHGRGTRVTAECRLTAEVTKRFLHVTPLTLVRGYQGLAKGSVAGGMVGININVANMIAALFTATGQDIASVHESGVGLLNVELSDDMSSVYASLTLPSLLLGSVGGGTNLPRQSECLRLMDCAGAGKSAALAEIICGFALALDLSTLSALASDEFAAAHHPLAKKS